MYCSSCSLMLLVNEIYFITLVLIQKKESWFSCHPFVLTDGGAKLSHDSSHRFEWYVTKKYVPDLRTNTTVSKPKGTLLISHAILLSHNIFPPSVLLLQSMFFSPFSKRNYINKQYLPNYILTKWYVRYYYLSGYVTDFKNICEWSVCRNGNAPGCVMYVLNCWLCRRGPMLHRNTLLFIITLLS